MSSLRRKLASRANGARSRGPVTPQGKARSAQNAISHGLLAQAVVLKSENADAFRAHMDDFVLRWQPADQVELGLVEEMAVANWRLRRLWAIETRSLDDAIDAAVSPDRVGRLTAGWSALASGAQLNALHRHESRLHMVYHRALNSLMLLQAERRDAVLDDDPPPAEPSAAPIRQNEPNPTSEHRPEPSAPDPAAPPDARTPAPDPDPGQPSAPSAPPLCS